MELWQEEERGEGDADDASPASRVRRRYERMFKERQDGAGDSHSPTAGSRGDPQGPAGPMVPRTAFVGSISSVFAKHLGCVAMPYPLNDLVALLSGELHEVQKVRVPFSTSV